MKIKISHLVNVWNNLNEFLLIAENPHCSSWAKRLIYYMEPELKLWNSLSKQERESILDKEVSFSVNKIPASQLPPVIPDHMFEALKPVIDGDEKPEYKSQLEKLVNGKPKSPQSAQPSPKEQTPKQNQSKSKE